MEENKKYVVYGMMAKCSEGTMENYISTKTGHGIIFQGQPVLNANDHVVKINLTHLFLATAIPKRSMSRQKKRRMKNLRLRRETAFL